MLKIKRFLHLLLLKSFLENIWKNIPRNIQSQKLGKITKRYITTISGTSIHIIGKSLGHKSSRATQIYARLSIAPIRQAMETATALIDELGNRKD